MMDEEELEQDEGPDEMDEAKEELEWAFGEGFGGQWEDLAEWKRRRDALKDLHEREVDDASP
jgi:hypothetical protein